MRIINNILITGATGYIGSNLARILVANSVDVHIIVRETSSLLPLSDVINKIIIHVHDGSFDSILNIVSSSKPDVVIHLASEYVLNNKSPQIKSLLNNNVTFPSQLLEAMSVCGVTKFINTGTSWKYYNSEDYQPVNLYAATKKAFEDILTYYVDVFSWNVVTLNLFDTYGPNDKRKKVINLLLDTATSSKELQLSPGEQLIDLVYISDVVSAYVRTIEIVNKMDTGHDQYGLSSESPIKLKDLVLICEKSWGIKLPVLWGARPYREREVMKPWTSYKRLPNWKPEMQLLDGLKVVYSHLSFDEKYKISTL